MLRYIFMFLTLTYASIASSNVVNYIQPSKNENIVFFLSTPKSGTNVITGSLSAITRKPISWFYWGNSIMDPASKNREHISYNRLGLTLDTDIPLLYRTHYQFNELSLVNSEKNKLIFVTRNPKELLYRKFLLEKKASEIPDKKFIEEFLLKYLKAFEIFEHWNEHTRMLVFYEDFIVNDDACLVQMLNFMNEPLKYYEDYLTHKQEYLDRLLQSYSKQHQHNNGGASSKGGPKPIYYTRNASRETLLEIDEFIKTNAPAIWVKYLKRFEEL